ncbi:MAG TPA: cation-translocating P-type ATPase [Chitinophagales bacterium]|nr:cation-translocating P-type ATPase [Chitinophagales bacterium]
MDHLHHHDEETETLPNDVELSVEGMTCTNCAMTVTKFLEKRGMKNVYVDFSLGAVKFDSNGNFNRDEVIKGINALGYHVASENVSKKKSSWNFLRAVESKFYFCLVFTLPLLLHMLLPFEFLHSASVQLLLCLPVYTVGFFYFGRSAWGSLRQGVPNMDVLIFIGSSAAFIYSLIGGIFLHNPDYLFFETAASIITLVLLGNVIEKKSVKRTRSAVEQLAKLQPQKAKRIDFYGDPVFEVISETDHDEIKAGHYFLVNTGDRIPADGKIVWGNAWIDEAMISGESFPVEKTTGADVITGTIVSDGTIKMQATAVGKQTVLSKIIEMVNDAQRNRPSIQKLADKITAVFVPVVLSVAALTFLIALFGFNLSFQRALMNSIGVLVIACPCAMGLATPTAVMVGIGRAARRGILIKGAQTLETFASVKTIVFDKTGTLTSGKFKIQNLKTIGISEEELRTILASVEKFSSHPIAKSISQELSDTRILSMKNVSELKGVSIKAIDEEGNAYEVGSVKILGRDSDSFADTSLSKGTYRVPGEIFGKVDLVQRNWNVFVNKNERLVGMANVKDEIRAEAKPMIAFLKSSGIKTVMLSGDKMENCKEVAEALGIDEFHAEKLPQEKLSIIEQLRKQGTVAMVGDGVNDAPPLAAATVGVSLSNATQVAIDSAQIILLHNDLMLLPEAINISKHTLATIKQNLFWAFFYNTLAIPIAAVGFLKPIVAALSMAFSDVIVIGNSLRLRTKKLR